MYDLYIVKRTQIYLDELQQRSLAQRASSSGMTRSALIREAIDTFLAADDQDGQLERLRAAVDAVAGTAPDLPPGEDYVSRLRAQDRARDESLAERS